MHKENTVTPGSSQPARTTPGGTGSAQTSTENLRTSTAEGLPNHTYEPPSQPRTSDESQTSAKDSASTAVPENLSPTPTAGATPRMRPGPPFSVQCSKCGNTTAYTPSTSEPYCTRCKDGSEPVAVPRSLPKPASGVGDDDSLMRSSDHAEQHVSDFDRSNVYGPSNISTKSSFHRA